jgi:hypothetical protein
MKGLEYSSSSKSLRGDEKASFPARHRTCLWVVIEAAMHQYIRGGCGGRQAINIHGGANARSIVHATRKSVFAAMTQSIRQLVKWR